MKVGLSRENALCLSKWCVDVNQIAAGLRCIWLPSLLKQWYRSTHLHNKHLLKLFTFSSSD